MGVDVRPRLDLSLFVQRIEHEGFLRHHVVKQEFHRERDTQELTDPIAVFEVLEIIGEGQDNA